jgi:hypothetical protein
MLKNKIFENSAIFNGKKICLEFLKTFHLYVSIFSFMCVNFNYVHQFMIFWPTKLKKKPIDEGVLVMNLASAFTKLKN